MAARARSAVPLRIAGAQGGPRGLTELQREMVACRACPRLVAWRELCGQEKVKRFRDWSYWSRPIPGFGDPKARLVLMGLAPAAHGDLARRALVLPRPKPRFAHGAVLRREGAPALLGSYHVSQQNTNTGKLTPAMLDEVLARAKELF